jgi:hypothetical protein
MRQAESQLKAMHFACPGLSAMTLALHCSPEFPGQFHFSDNEPMEPI